MQIRSKSRTKRKETLMSMFETATIAIQIITLLAVLIASWAALRNLKLIAHEHHLAVLAHEQNHEWNRRIATQDALAALRSINLDSLNKEFGFANQRTSIPLKTINEKFLDKPELQNSCHKLLNFYEGLASGVHLGIYDELTVKINRRGAIERDFAKFREYIEHRRDLISSTLFIEIEKLINKWRDETINQSTRNVTGKLL